MRELVVSASPYLVAYHIHDRHIQVLRSCMAPHGGKKNSET